MKISVLAITTLNWRALDTIADQQERDPVTRQLSGGSVKIDDPLAAIKGLSYFLLISQEQAQELTHMSLGVEFDEGENVSLILSSMGIPATQNKGFYYFDATISKWIQTSIRLTNHDKQIVRKIGNQLINLFKTCGLRHFLSYDTIKHGDGTFSLKV